MANSMAAVALNARSASRRCNREALLVGTCKEFLPESEGHVGGALGVAETPEAIGRLLAGGGA